MRNLILLSCFATLISAKGWYDFAATPTPTPTPTSSSTATTTTTTANPCANGCIVTIGTQNGPMRPPPVNTAFNGGNPLIPSYPTTQP